MIAIIGRGSSKGLGLSEAAPQRFKLFLLNPPHEQAGTPFQMGIIRGIERAKRWDRGDLMNKE